VDLGGLAGRLWYEARLLAGDIRASPRLTMLVVGVVVLAVVSIRDGLAAVADALTTGHPFSAPLDLFGGVLYAVVTYACVAATGWVIVYVLAYIGAAFWTLGRRRAAARLRRVFGGIGLGVLALVLMFLAHVGAWELLVTAGLLAGLAWLTRGRRMAARRRRWLLVHIAQAVGERYDEDPKAWRVEHDTWDERGRLTGASVWYPARIRVADPGVRAAIERAVTWALRQYRDTQYTLRWRAGATVFSIGAEPPLPDYVADRAWPQLRAGILLGVCAHAYADAIVRGTELGDLGVRAWNPDHERDLLIAGVKGSGKTVLARGIVVRGLRDGWWPGGVWILDGKGGADYASLDGREGVVVVARTPEQWSAALQHLVAVMEARYSQRYEYEAGSAPAPVHPRMGVVLDEVQAIRYALGDQAIAPLDALARMARAANQSLIVATQRPDARDAIPGAIRDQLEDRVAVGWMSEQGARMVLDTAWRLVADPDGQTSMSGEAAQRPRGRAVVRVAGRLCAIQIPDLPTPVHVPAVEALYPPRDESDVPAPPRPRPPKLATPPPPGGGEPAADEPARPRKWVRRTD
jgi:hypothetical protein